MRFVEGCRCKWRWREVKASDGQHNCSIIIVYSETRGTTFQAHCRTEVGTRDTPLKRNGCFFYGSDD